MKKLEIVALSHFSDMLEKAPEEFQNFGKSFAKAEKRVRDDQENVKESCAVVGKWLFAFKIHWETVKTGAIYAGRSFRESVNVYLGIGKDDAKNALNRAQSCCNAFRLIHMKLVKEETYDSVKVDTLVAASEVITKLNDDLRDGGLDKQHAAIIETVNILNGQAENKAKLIRKVKDRIRVDADKNISFLTPEQVEQETSGSMTPMKASEVAGDLARTNPTALIAAVVAMARNVEHEESVRELITLGVQMPDHIRASVDDKNHRRFSEERLHEIYTEVADAQTSERSVEYYEAKFKTAYNQLREIKAMFENVGKADSIAQWTEEVMSQPVAA